MHLYRPGVMVFFPPSFFSFSSSFFIHSIDLTNSFTAYHKFIHRKIHKHIHVYIHKSTTSINHKKKTETNRNPIVPPRPPADLPSSRRPATLPTAYPPAVSGRWEGESAAPRPAVTGRRLSRRPAPGHPSRRLPFGRIWQRGGRGRCPAPGHRRPAFHHTARRRLGRRGKERGGGGVREEENRG